ncbi:8-oxo-dGTP pyrophosphatase MutT (NUDIX family) [Inhella inkyongensis]|uniref:8-oxo-dGTP pyrophosphatase MutT (NUDIX family) n=1 Tax=Inhella inkyongensis TaxID=392593 RepID=A0A840S6Y8_9BURK|nr:NUDIX domain-containing protein [Inhella inkyongensis]MBB5205372.1 8-oxo-dGTP pyrophosphatase MutT (NUDIX family) [Inhella inkyongensis]
MRPLPDQALSLLMAHCATHTEQAPRLQRLRSWLEERGSAGADLAARSHWPAHLTVSALAWEGERVLLIHHRASGLWLPPGGHLEATDLSLQAGALRELQEETGLCVEPEGLELPEMELRASEVLDIDSHPIAARADKGEPAHWHHDFLFLVQLQGMTPAFEPQPQWAEVAGARWLTRAEALRLGNARLSRALQGLPRTTT